MGAYAAMDAEKRYEGDPFEEEDSIPAFEEAENQAPQDVPPAPALDSGAVPTESKGAQKDDADESAKRKAHEEAEAKRKAEWEARQQKRRAATQEQLDRLATMSDDEVMAASMQRVSTDTERLTRRNMKECVAEYIQTLCVEDAAFARRVMHPRKSMIHCIWYINRRAKEFIQQEMEDNSVKPENGIYGSDVPDDLCYQWAVDYFNDPEAKEDEEKEEKFVPKPYIGKVSASKGKTKKADPKKKPEKPASAKSKPDEDSEQISFDLLGAAS